jgi:hypothetical protein
MRRVLGIERKAFRIELEQAGVVGSGMLQHRSVWLEQDVDGGDPGLIPLGVGIRSKKSEGADHGTKRKEAGEFHRRFVLW